MKKVFITGGTGFIGKEVVKLFLSSGYQINALVRDISKAKSLWGDSVSYFEGTLDNLKAIESGMSDCDFVVHSAGYYAIGRRDRMEFAEKTNVEGTFNVLSTAKKLGISHSIYISTLAVYGNTKGKIFNETTPLDSSPANSEYEKTKRKAHKIALDFLADGLNLSILLPGVVFGKDDHSLFGEAMKFYLKGQLPILLGSDTKITYVHVTDIARAVLQAVVKQISGEFITSGPAFSIKEVVALWGNSIQKPVPNINVPGFLLRPSWPLMEALGWIFPLPQILSGETTKSAGNSYLGSSKKANALLDWRVSPLENHVKETVEYTLNQISTQ